MNPFNIVIIEDKQSDFFRLQEQIRARASGIGKIYSCRFHSEFLELLKEKDLALVISENEIGGRTDVGLQFFHDFYNTHRNSHLYSFIYTWGTYDYQNFRIRIHALSQRHPNFLGAIFKQIGDHDKILEIIESIHRSRPYPFFDQPLMESEQKEVKQEQRKDSEKLIDLHHRIEERLLFFIQIARFHLEHRIGLDFRQTLKEFPDSRERLLARLSALSEDVNELMAFAEETQHIERANEITFRTSIDLYSSTETGRTSPLRSTNFKNAIEMLLNNSDTADTPILTERPEVLLQEFLKNYDDFSYFVSRLVDTAQAAIKSKSNTRRLDA